MPGGERNAPRRSRWTVLEWSHVLLLLLATGVHWIPRLQGPIDLRYDAGVYYVLGTSLAEGKGYRLLNEPGEIQAIQYPPLLPAWVALHQIVTGTSDPLVVGQALRYSSAALSFLLAFLAYALARRLLAAWPALFASAVASLYFHTLYLEDLCFAEVPFAIVSLGFLLASEAVSRPLRWLAYPLAAAAFFLRTAGVALLGAWTLTALLRREWGSAARRGLLALACVLAWQGHVWRVTHGPEYERPAYPYQRAPYQYYNVSYAENLALDDPFRPEGGGVSVTELASRAVRQLPELLMGLGESVSTTRGFWEWPIKSLNKERGMALPLLAAVVPLLVLGSMVLLGLVRSWLEDQRLLVLFVACSLALIVITPWPKQFARYLAPLAPLLAIALTGTLVRIRRRIPSLASGLALLVLASQAFTMRQTYSVYHHAIHYPRESGEPLEGTLFFFDEAHLWRPFYGALWWLRENTPSEAVVATSCPHLVWLHARRKAVMPPLVIEVEEAQRLLDAVPVDYVVVDGLRFVDMSRRYAAPVMERHPELWEPVHRDSSGGLTIYRRKH